MRIKEVFTKSSGVLIIAELSANHKGSLDLAFKTIRAMKRAGADAVKVQTYTPDTLTMNSRNRHFRIKGGTLWDGRTLYDLYKEAMTPWDWHPKLKKCAEENGLEFFSSPFDPTAVSFLSKLGVPAYKIASFEITDLPLIKLTASKGRPVLISTGIASAAEIADAVAACRAAGNRSVALLKCTSAYPAPVSEANLLTMGDMASRFRCRVGVSDHTGGLSVPAAAAALGARIVEKHFILDRSLGGPDAAFSMEPDEFSVMARAAREACEARGKVSYTLSAKTRKNRAFARSLFVVKGVRKGETATPENVRSIRPGFGLAPKFLPAVLGRKFNRSVKAGTPLQKRFLSA